MTSAWSPGRRTLSYATGLYQLTKPRITRLVVLTAVVGFYLGAPGTIDFLLLAATLLGTALVASGTNALNQWWEREADASMDRTRHRPLPSGRVLPAAAFLFAAGISVAGIMLLWIAVNTLTAALAAMTLIAYVAIYTPLKRKTASATIVGAIPGALPILGGWTAATGTVDIGGWALFTILFLWQLPHFHALGWIYREDYALGGFRLLCVNDPEGNRTAGDALRYSVLLLPVSLFPTPLGLTGSLYLTGATVLGIGLVVQGFTFRRHRSHATARRLFLSSVIYLPVLLILMAADKVT